MENTHKISIWRTEIEGSEYAIYFAKANEHDSVDQKKLYFVTEYEGLTSEQTNRIVREVNRFSGLDRDLIRIIRGIVENKSLPTRFKL